MPTYEYICTDCNKRYDIFHKVREIKEDIVCPACGSNQHKRVMSITALSFAGTSSSYSHSNTSPSCESGSCCGGSCSVN